jgi:hypothetical protein
VSGWATRGCKARGDTDKAINVLRGICVSYGSLGTTGIRDLGSETS